MKLFKIILTIIFSLIIIINLINLSFALGNINDLVNSYNFSYSKTGAKVSALNLTVNNDLLNLNLNLSTIDSNLTFIYGIENENIYTSKFFKLNKNKRVKVINLNLNLTLIKSSNYSLFLKLYSEKGLIFSDLNFTNLTFKNSKTNFSRLDSKFIFENQTFILKNSNNSYLGNKSINLLEAKPIDLTRNTKFDILTLTFLLNNLNKSGNFLIKTTLSDEFYLNKLVRTDLINFHMGENIFKINFSGSNIYNSKLDPFKIRFLSIFDETGTILFSSSDILLNSSLDFSSFTAPILADIVVKNISYNKSEDFANFFFKNSGGKDAVGILVEIFNENLTLISERIISKLIINQSINFSQNVGFNQSKLFVLVDSPQFISENFKFNNQLFWPVNLTEICNDGLDNNRDGFIDENCKNSSQLPNIQNSRSSSGESGGGSGGGKIGESVGLQKNHNLLEFDNLNYSITAFNTTTHINNIPSNSSSNKTFKENISKNRSNQNFNNNLISNKNFDKNYSLIPNSKSILEKERLWQVSPFFVGFFTVIFGIFLA